jgi:DNA-directed RNA polymerase subunit K/omega
MDDNNKNFPSSNLKIIYDEEDSNRFLITTAVAKRARQLKEGAKPMIDVDHDLPIGYVKIALKELEEKKYEIHIKEAQKKEVDILDKMDESLNKTLEKKEKEDEKDKKLKDKGRGKKSLAA